MGLTDLGLAPEERIAEWKRVMERIRTEHIDLGWSHYVFRLLREVFNANAGLRESGGFLIEAIARMYVSHTLMVLRRDMDRQSGTENVRNLLYDMKSYAELMTRERFVSVWNPDDEFVRKLANSRFEDWGVVRHDSGPDSDYIDPSSVQKDVDDLEIRVTKAREYAERVMAHRTPMSDEGFSITYREMHEAIDALRETINRYYALLTGSSMIGWEPVRQYNTLAPFLEPWLPKNDDVLRTVNDAVDKIERDDA